MTNKDYTASFDHGDAQFKLNRITRTPKVICMADVQPREVEWLWDGKIPVGRITLLAGNPGLGKSFVTCDIAARVTRGISFPDGGQCQKGSVLFIACEDDPADTIRPRLDAHRADPDRVHLLDCVQVTGEEIEREQMFTLGDIEALETALNGIKDCRLVIIDPIGSYIGTTANSNSDNEVRSVLAPVAQLAEKHNVAVVIVAHTRKSVATRADDMVMGSRAFTGIARAVWHLQPDPDDDNRRLLLAGKNNMSAKQEGLSFVINGHPAAIDWSNQPETRTADDVLAQLFEIRKKPTAKDHAAKWLKSFLGNRQVVKDEILDAAKEHGHSEKSINAASMDLGVIKKPVEYGGKYFWWIPVEPESAHCPPVTENGGDSGAISSSLSEIDPESSRVLQSDPTAASQEPSGDDSVVEGEL